MTLKANVLTYPPWPHCLIIPLLHGLLQLPDVGDPLHTVEHDEH